MNSQLDKDEERMRELFGAVNRQGFKATPYLQDQVMAEIVEREAGKTRFQSKAWAWFRLHWSGFATGAAVSAAFALVVTTQSFERRLEANVNADTVMLIAPDGRDQREVSFVQVELPEGVRFRSDDFPELGDRAVITLPWSGDGTADSLPVVIHSNESGTKVVKVRFLDAKDRKLKERELKIRFRETSTGRSRI